MEHASGVSPRTLGYLSFIVTVLSSLSTLREGSCIAAFSPKLQCPDDPCFLLTPRLFISHHQLVCFVWSLWSAAATAPTSRTREVRVNALDFWRELCYLNFSCAKTPWIKWYNFQCLVISLSVCVPVCLSVRPSSWIRKQRLLIQHFHPLYIAQQYLSVYLLFKLGQYEKIGWFELVTLQLESSENENQKGSFRPFEVSSVTDWGILCQDVYIRLLMTPRSTLFAEGMGARGNKMKVEQPR